MLSSISSAVITGIEALPVEIEVDSTAEGKGQFNIIGLGDGAIREARERVRLALVHSGYGMPGWTLAHLAPAEVKKEGAGLDLAIALGVLSSSRQIKLEPLDGKYFFGELALDGRLKAIKGIAALVLKALELNAKQIIVPNENISEASLVGRGRVVGADSLQEVIEHLSGVCSLSYFEPKKLALKRKVELMSEVCGQALAQRALIIAACGAHNALLVGPPGCGKSMMARRVGSLLPRLTHSEQIDVLKIHSVAGEPLEKYIQGERPFRSPHHIVSDVALSGGGASPQPGEVSLAHNGVLFLDEFPEFRRSTLEALRTPLEDSVVTVTRVKGKATFPANFQLIAAMNPCPCGKQGVPGMSCVCSMGTLSTYRKKLSQPILDRIDIQVAVRAVGLDALSELPARNELELQEQEWREAVERTRSVQLERQGKLNSELSYEELNRCLQLEVPAKKLMLRAGKTHGLSARGYTRVLRVAATLADYEGVATISAKQIGEALQYRLMTTL